MLSYNHYAKTRCVPGPQPAAASASATDPTNGLSSEDISLSISLPSGGGEDDKGEEDESDLSSQEIERLEQVRSGIFKLLSEDHVAETSDDDEGAAIVADGDDATDFRNAESIERTSRYIVSGGNETARDDETTNFLIFNEKHEFEVIWCTHEVMNHDQLITIKNGFFEFKF